jgi:hypothetical protein
LRKSNIKNQQTLLLVACAALIISLFNIGNFSKSRVYGHDFIPNESASFLSFANQLKTESELVEDPVNNVTWKDEIAERNQ